MADIIDNADLNIGDPFMNPTPESEMSDDANKSLSPKQVLTVVLVGKTGHGKSATGNSILQREEFRTFPNGDSDMSSVKRDTAEIDEYVVNVIDGLDLGYGAEEREKSCDQVAAALQLCPEGFNALLLVFKFGNRFGSEDEEAIDALKDIFGNDVIRDYGVIVTTYGDLFDTEYSDHDYFTLRDWLKQETGQMKELFKECRYRGVLFRNRTKCIETKNEQVRQLLQIVSQIKSAPSQYVNTLFANVEYYRARLKVESKMSQLQEEVLLENTSMLAELRHIRANDFDMEAHQTGLDGLEARVTALMSKVTEADNETGVLESLQEYLKNLLTSIELERHGPAERKRNEERLNEQQAEEFRKSLYQNNEKWSQILDSMESDYKSLTDNLTGSFNATFEKMKEEENRLQAQLERKKRNCTIL